VAAIFDAFFTVYIHKTRDLFRIAYPDGKAAVPNFLHSDLALRLADTAAKTAATMQKICLRALDYCPPVDITFGDYLRALVTADRAGAADDDRGYRAAIIASFRERGIRPHGIRSYAEEELAWQPYTGRAAPNSLRWLWSDLTKFEDDPTEKNAENLRSRLWRTTEAMSTRLGLSSKEQIHPESWHTVQRVMPDGFVQRQIVAQLIQSRHVTQDVDETGPFRFRGGTTLVIDRQGQIQYSISKPLHGPEGKSRLRRQREYLRQLASASALTPYQEFDPDRALTFRIIHRGY
jgi:hypothetical protein